MNEIIDQIARDHLRKVTLKEDFVSACCPFHKGGMESHPSFWVSRSNGRWGCFACPEAGNLRELLAHFGIKGKRVEEALKEAEEEGKKQALIDKAKKAKKSRSTFKGDYILPDALLGVYDWMPVDLVEDGFSEQVLMQHDIGFDRERNRITFPIRDLYGNLIGISGRSTIGEAPKYLVYNGRRKRDDGKEVMGELGEWYPDYSNEGIKDHLWRGNFVYSEVMAGRANDQVIVVEGYKAAMWLVQHDWLETVALMGSKMSPGQERILRRMGVPVFVLLDNNGPGQEGAYYTCQRLAVSTFPVYRCYYPDYCDEDAQPDDLSEEELTEVLTQAQRVGGKFHGTRRKMAKSKKPGPKRKTKRWRG